MQAKELRLGMSCPKLLNMSIMLTLFLAMSVIMAGLSGCDAGQAGGDLSVDAGTVSVVDSGVSCNPFLCEEGRLHAATGEVFGGSCEYSVGIVRTCDFGCNTAKSQCAAMPDGTVDAGTTDTGVVADSGSTTDTGVQADAGTIADAAVVVPTDAGVCTLACLNHCAGNGRHLDIFVGCMTDNSCRASGAVIDCALNTPGGQCRAVSGVDQCVVLAADGGVVADAGNPADAAANPDAGTTDTGVVADSGSTPDSGNAADTGISDTGVDLDSSVPDASETDTGVSDAGVADAGPDGGADGGLADGGFLPLCPGGQGRLRGVCVGTVNGCYPFYIHCFPATPMTMYVAAPLPGDLGVFARTSSATPSTIYAGFTESHIDSGFCSAAFPLLPLDAFCVDETINGFSVLMPLASNPGQLGAIHNTYGSSTPPPGPDAGPRDAGAPD